MFLIIGESSRLKVLWYTKVHNTIFQAHVKRGFSNFIRNFLPFLLFAEENWQEENGTGKDAIVSKKMHPVIIGLCKKVMRF